MTQYQIENLNEMNTWRGTDLSHDNLNLFSVFFNDLTLIAAEAINSNIFTDCNKIIAYSNLWISVVL